MPQALSTDILIVGGGIAGLWLNARLRRAGYATVLVESASLGGGQSVKSQGIIHGGAKYALPELREHASFRYLEITEREVVDGRADDACALSMEARVDRDRIREAARRNPRHLGIGA